MLFCEGTQLYQQQQLDDIEKVKDYFATAVFAVIAVTAMG